eukprot:scaffold70080_cov45-Phaeocystis_antarctica.AAC.1
MSEVPLVAEHSWPFAWRPAHVRGVVLVRSGTESSPRPSRRPRSPCGLRPSTLGWWSATAFTTQ